jgi:hypothetical protein
MTLVWSDTNITECPACGCTVVVGLASLCATCPYDGCYYVDINGSTWERGWYLSKAAFDRGEAPVGGKA